MLGHLDRGNSLDSCFLATGQRSASFADQSSVLEFQLFEIFFQSTRLDNHIVSIAIHFLTKQNILSNRAGEYPRLLARIRNFAAYADRTAFDWQFAQQRLQQ